MKNQVFVVTYQKDRSSNVFKFFGQYNLDVLYITDKNDLVTINVVDSKAGRNHLQAIVQELVIHGIPFYLSKEDEK